MNYFAYGSNMANNRIRERVPSTRFVGVYTLMKHVLRFHKVWRDESAKCNAFYTGSDSDIIEGVIFDVNPKEVIALDRAEDLGKGYIKKNVKVSNFRGDWIEAFTYFAIEIDDSLLPFSWYKNHVLLGAKKAGLSAEYIAKIENVKAFKDPNQDREKREFAIHQEQ